VSEQSSEVVTGRSGHVVAHLVEVMRYKPKRYGFDSGWCYWYFSMSYGVTAQALTQQVTEMSTRNVS
jgi:hypothetical protein